MTQSPPTSQDRQFNAIAAVLAWVWPGLGHISLGHTRRGGLIMFGVLFLFLGGVLVGGIDSVDHENDHLWFLAQSLCGPLAFIIDFINQSFIKKLPVPDLYRAIAINKPNEMGTLFSALAGLMNLVVILDAMFFAPKELPARRERRKSASARQVSADATPTQAP